MDVLTAIGSVSQASSPFLLALAVWAFASGRVVARWVYDQERREKEEWKSISQGYSKFANRSLDVVEQRQNAS